MNMLHGIHDARGIVKILQHRFSIFALLSINNMDSSTRSTEICPVASEVHIVTRVLPGKDDIPCCRGDDILDQCSRKQQTAVLGHRAAGFGHEFLTGRYSICNTDLLQCFQCCLVNTNYFRFCERLISP